MSRTLAPSWRRPTGCTAALVLLAALAGCVRGGFEPNGLREPRPIPGGGFAGGPIAGALTIFVLDSATDGPIAGAPVWLGDGDRFKRSNAEGRVVIVDPELRGPLTVTAGFPGFTTLTVVDLDADELTLSLERRTPTAPKGQVAGTLEGWGALPALAPNHARVGVTSYAVRNLFTEPKLPQSELALYDPPARPAWRLTVPAGEATIYGVVLEVDAAFKEEATLTHVGFRSGVAVQAGATTEGVAIPLVAASESIPFELPPLPAGTTEARAYPLLELASGALLDLGHRNLRQTSVPVPPPEGPFAGGRTWLRVEAAGDSAGGAAHHLSFALLPGVQPGQTARPALLAPPSAVSFQRSPERIGFTRSPGATLHFAEIRAERDARPLWNLWLFSKATAVAELALPKVPAGAEVERPPVGGLALLVAAVGCCPAVAPQDFVARREIQTIRQLATTELVLVP